MGGAPALPKATPVELVRHTVPGAAALETPLGPDGTRAAGVGATWVRAGPEEEGGPGGATALPSFALLLLPVIAPSFLAFEALVLALVLGWGAVGAAGAVGAVVALLGTDGVGAEELAPDPALVGPTLGTDALDPAAGGVRPTVGTTTTCTTGR